MAGEALSLRGISKSYWNSAGEIDALTDIDLDVAEGAFVAIMGRSGSGKSTLLNIMSLIDDATRGSFSFFGHQVVGLGERQRATLRRRLTSFIFEEIRLIDELSVRANVEVGILYRGMTASDRHEYVDEAMELAAIGHRADDPVHQLSAGQQRRVEIARAFVSNPRLLFADEPAGNLDARSVEQVMRALAGLNDMGTTIVMATHSADYARCADEIIYLADGSRMSDHPPLASTLRRIG